MRTASATRSIFRRSILLAVPGALVAGALAGVSSAGTPGDVRIATLSTRADLVSGQDVLIRVTTPGTSPASARLALNGRDVTKAFRAHSNGRGIGLLTGLRVGRNVVRATLPDGRGAALAIVDHPLGGPVFAGPQIRPWTCSNGSKSPKCYQKPTFSYSYVDQTGGTQPYDPSSPPPDSFIKSTTTTDGVTVPFIYRTETGYIDRDQYSITALWQPKKKWTGWAPQKQFNHRMVITHGASCDEQYQTAGAPDTTDQGIVGAGFLVISNALDNAGHNCNLVVQAESLLMTKEYAIDRYGTVRWTIGSGCSGGSLVQQQDANAYPGIYQGMTPQCSFTDAWSSAMQYEEYYFGLQFFDVPSRWGPGVIYDPVAMRAFFDHPNLANPVTFTTAIPNSGNPSRSCPGVAQDKVYDAQTNPHGVRCTLQDYMVNAFGRDEHGFARRGFDNVGVQYGLKGLRQGEISPAQFVDFNNRIGGADIDLNITPARTAADPIALERLYRTGAIDSANNLDKVAIIDLRGPDPGAFHDVYRTYAMRARLERNFGSAANQVLWRGQAPLIGDPSYADDAVFAMDKWLARVHADKRKGVPLAEKIIQDKPDSVAERCTDGNGTEAPSEVCDKTVSAYGTPRLGAGEPMTDDVMKCQLKPLRRDDYPVTFTDAQWKSLSEAFPGGVCDYGKPGVSQHGAVAWLTYQRRDGRVIYGGKPLGPRPRSHRLRK